MKFPPIIFFVYVSINNFIVSSLSVFLTYYLAIFILFYMTPLNVVFFYCSCDTAVVKLHQALG